MPIELDNASEIKCDLMNYSDELFKQLDASIEEGQIKTTYTYIQIKLSTEQMHKARLIALSRKCTLSSLFEKSISKMISDEFNKSRGKIENSLMPLLKKTI